MKKPIFLITIIICWGCMNKTITTEKYHNKRDNIINIREKVKEIEIEDVLIGRISSSYIIDEYLIITDYNSYDALIHIFNKNNFDYITSTGYKGQGPGEIVNLGTIGINEKDRIFYATDHGKQKIFSYNLDSVLANPGYPPKEKIKLDEKQFPNTYHYINDTLCIGTIIEPISNNDFKPTIAKWNMTTGAINKMPYEHPEIDRKRISFGISIEHQRYVESYLHHDLISIFNLGGELIHNVYGPKWNSEINKQKPYHFSNVMFCKNKILALYYDQKEEDQKGRSLSPTQIMIFDIKGNYVQTLETGYQISCFCYDKDNNRVILCLDDDIQFGYLELEGLIR